MNQTTAVNPSALLTLQGNIDDLPLLPQVLVKILGLSPTSDDYFEQFEKLAREDPAFAVRIMAIANSASSAPVAPITSLDNALTRMGTQAICRLVASLAVQRVFTPTKPNEVRLWQHSICTAVASQRVAELAAGLQVDPGTAYLAGLLHDIGRFIMFEHAAPELLSVDEDNWQSTDDLIAADVEIFKYTHSELGFLVCNHWGMPDVVAAVVRGHHTPLHGELAPASADALTFCVEIADRLCISILEQPDLMELDEQQCKQRILLDCLQTPHDRKWLSADSIAANLAPIRAASGEILSGLGYPL